MHGFKWPMNQFHTRIVSASKFDCVVYGGFRHPWPVLVELAEHVWEHAASSDGSRATTTTANEEEDANLVHYFHCLSLLLHTTANTPGFQHADKS